MTHRLPDFQAGAQLVSLPPGGSMHDDCGTEAPQNMLLFVSEEDRDSESAVKVSKANVATRTAPKS
jgi:hypothetical protein